MPTKAKQLKEHMKTGRISRTMRVAEILAFLPESESLLARYGLSCFHCSANAYEALDEGCRTHGFTDEDIDDLVTDLNELLGSRPQRPQTLTITLPAAQALLDIAKSEGKAGQVLLVGVDDAGGFCMEFQEKATEDSAIFSHPDVPAMQLFATSLTLQRIGGSTIDFRDGRFKLDLPASKAGLPHDLATNGCGCGKASCACA